MTNFFSGAPDNADRLLFLCQDLAAQLKAILDTWLNAAEYLLVRDCASECRGLTRAVPPGHFLSLLPDICQDISQHQGWDFEWLRELDGELCLFKTTAKEYILETKPADASDIEDSDLLDAEFPPGNIFHIVWYPDADPNHVSCHIVPEQDYQHVRPYPNRPHDSSRRAQAFEMLQLAKDGAPVKCVFVYLGWLAEQRIQPPPMEREVTYYQVLLNLSTDPVSVWVMYAYDIFDWPYQWTNQLGPYTNRLYNNARVSHKRKDPNPFCLYKSNSPPAGYKDFRTSYTNVGEKDPAVATGKTPTTPTREGFYNTDVDHSCDQPTTQSGYFGLRQPFDLALLAPDINTWTADGFDPREVEQCLDSSHVRLGASMQKESLHLDCEKLEDALSDRVDIQGLCFRQHRRQSKTRHPWLAHAFRKRVPDRAIRFRGEGGNRLRS